MGARPSRYNVLVRCGSRAAVLNTLTGLIVDLSEEEYEALRRGDLDRLSGGLEGLVELGVVERREGEQLELIRRSLERAKLPKRRGAIHVTLVVTYDCNFACRYCYYGADKPRGSHMGRGMVRSVLSFVRSRVEEFELRRLSVTFYGGEPLLNFGVMEEFLSAVERSLPGVATEYALVTNGSIYDDEVEGILTSYNFTRVQVTLDGPPDVHDRLRVFRDGRGTFSVVYPNVLRMCDAIPGRVHVRVNVSRETARRVPELLDMMRDDGLVGRVVLSFEALTEGRASFGGRRYSEVPPLEPPTARELLELYREAASMGFSVSLPVPSLRPGPCLAVNKLSYVIDPYGLIYKCWEALGLPEFAVGDLWRGVDEPRERVWLEWTPLRYEKCVRCALLPYCMGLCPAETIVKGRPEPRCHALREALEDYARLLVEIVSARRSRKPRGAGAALAAERAPRAAGAAALTP